MTNLAREFSRYREHGDVAGLAAVFDATVARLTSLALHLCGDPADAEDAVQATFLVAIRKAATFDPQRRLEPWLVGILEGEAANLRRTRRRRPAASLDRAPELALACAAAGPLQASERRELVELLRTRVDRLPHDLRQVLLLQLQHGLAAVEVAEVLGLSPGAVRMRIHRGLAALRRLLPASLGALLVGMLPTRGLAAMRATVLGAGARQAASMLGGVLMKKVAATCCVVLLAALGWVGIAAPWSAAPPLPTAAPTLAAAVGTAPAAEQPSAPIADEPGAADTARVVVADAEVAADANAPGTLRLQVVTYETERPVARATARLRPQRSDADGDLLQRTLTTDAQGEARVEGLAPGDYELVVHCGATRTVHIAAQATTEVVVDVMTGNPVHGIVVFADGRPAPRAQIVLDSDDSVFDGGLADADGRFRLDAVYPFFRVGARLPGQAPSGLHELDPDRELRIVLPGPAAVLHGTVVDADGRAVALARLRLSSEQAPAQWQDEDGHTVQRGGDASLQCDAAGRFAAEMPPGRVRVRVVADGFAPLEQFVDAGAESPTELRMQLRRSAPLRGRLVDQHGLAVAAATVRLGGDAAQTRTTDAEGSFVFAAVPLGPLALHCEHPSIEPLDGERAVDDGAACTLVALRRPSYPMRFVDAHGGPLRFLVRCADLDAPSVQTDANGRVAVIAPLAPTGLELRDKLQRLHLDWPAGAQPDIETTVVVPTGSDRMATVQGHLAEADGTPVASARLSLTSRAGTNAVRAFAEDGAFHCEVLPDDYRLVVDRGDGTPPVPFPLDGLAAGERRDVGTLRLPALSTVTLRVLRSDGTPANGVQLFFATADDNRAPRIVAERVAVAAIDDGDDSDGVPWSDAEPRAWPVGHYEFRIEASNALPMRGAFDVTAGHPTIVELVLPAATPQRVRLPVPAEWNHPARVEHELVAPDGTIVARGVRTPATGLDGQIEAPLCAGRWQLVRRLPDGSCFVGEFTVPDLTPGTEPFVPPLLPMR